MDKEKLWDWLCYNWFYSTDGRAVVAMDDLVGAMASGEFKDEPEQEERNTEEELVN